MSRKLVTVHNITYIKPIEGADRIEEVSVDGWSVVAQKGIHTIGDTVLYFEIDSFLPASDARFESFMKFGTRTFEEVLGHRIKTVRLKGVYSQGVIMPLNEFPELKDVMLFEDFDFSELIGRDLTLEEKEHYTKSYSHKDNLTIITIVFDDFFEHRLN